MVECCYHSRVLLVAATFKENTMSVYKRGRKGTHWHYYFRVRGVRYRGALPEARTKWDAEQAESKLKQDIFEGKFGKLDAGTMKLSDFIDDIYMPWAKTNKKSWLNDHYNSFVLKEYFGSKELRAIQPLDIERFKSKRLATDTKNETPRAPASVNREYELLSRILISRLMSARPNLILAFG